MFPLGMSYVVPTPGAPSAFGRGLIRRILPRRSLVFAAVLRAS
jgi:hypothetical protein